MTDTHIIKLTAAQTAEKIASGELTAVEVTEAHLARIDATDEKVHAFLHVDREGALAQAAAVDAKREAACEARPAGRLYRSPSRTSSPPSGSRPPSVRRSSKAGSRPTTPP